MSQGLNRIRYEEMSKEQENAMSRFLSRNHTPPRQAFDLPMLYGGIREKIALFEVEAFQTEETRLYDDLEVLDLDYRLAEDLMPGGNEDSSYTTVLAGKEPESIECIPEECLEDPRELGLELGYPEKAVEAYEKGEAVTRHERDEWTDRTNLSQEQFDFLEFVPYRPAPELESVQAALQEGRENYRSLQIIANDYSFPQLREKLDDRNLENSYMKTD